MTPIKFALHVQAIAAAAKRHGIHPAAVEDVARATQTRVSVSEYGVLSYPGFVDLDEMLSESKKQDVIRKHNYGTAEADAPAKAGLTTAEFESMSPSEKMRHGTMTQAVKRGDIPAGSYQR